MANFLPSDLVLSINSLREVDVIIHYLLNNNSSRKITIDSARGELKYGSIIQRAERADSLGNWVRSSI